MRPGPRHAPSGEDTLRVFRLSPARASIGLTHMLEIAAAEPDTKGLVPVMEAARAAQEEVVRDLLQWDRDRRASHPARLANDVDPQLDRSINMLWTVCDQCVRGFDPDSAQALHATRIMEAAFARGVREITGAPFAVQHARVNALLDLLDGALKSDIAALGFQEMVERIRELNTEYGQLVSRRDAGPTAARIREGREAARAALLRVVAHIVATFPEPEEASDRRRAALMAPLQTQQNEESRLRARRRGASADDVEDAELQVMLEALANHEAEMHEPEPADAEDEDEAVDAEAADDSAAAK